MWGVFSDSSGNFIAPGEKSQSGWSVVTGNTVRGNKSTDIPEDFWIPNSSDSHYCNKLQVPDGATQILFSPADGFFSDNVDRNNNFVSNVHIMKAQARVGYLDPVQVVMAPQDSLSDGYYEYPYSGKGQAFYSSDDLSSVV